MGLRNESPNNHVLGTIEKVRLNRGKTSRDMSGSSKLCAVSPKLAIKTFSSLTFLYWLYNSYPQQRGEINETQARNGSKLGIIGLIINSGPKNQLVYSQSQITQEIDYNRSNGHEKSIIHVGCQFCQRWRLDTNVWSVNASVCVSTLVGVGQRAIKA